jgi:methionyl-tRNA synthetase
MLEAWMKEASVKGFWSNNAIQMTQAWIRDGIHERCITRDLKWGIPVPLPQYKDKVFYVWFDAPIGYISISACHTKDWKSWWMDPKNVELFQFIGKDNIPFHTVVFPSSLLGDGRDWTMLHHMSSTEYLNYEGGKFSKSKGVGVFGTDAVESGIPADVWRFYIYYNRPEKSDVNFTWADFQEKVNGELIGNLGNLVNRTLTFVTRYYDGKIPEAPADTSFRAKVDEYLAKVTASLERADLRDALHAAFELSSLANKAFQDAEPWRTRTTDPAKAASLIQELCFVIKDLAIILSPFTPASADKLASFFGKTIGTNGLSWKDLGKREGLDRVITSEVLFKKLEDDQVAELKARYAGSQAERKERDGKAEAASAKEAKPAAKAPDAKPVAPKKPEPEPIPVLTDPVEIAKAFQEKIELRVAEIIKIERHPKADKLYIETLNDGSGTERVIVSGLVPFYKEEELLGKRVILAANLKPAKLRGIDSRGMLLAASVGRHTPEEIVEVLEAPWATPGTLVQVEGDTATPSAKAEVDIDTFFSIPIEARAGAIFAGKAALTVNGQRLGTKKVPNGSVG